MSPGLHNQFLHWNVNGIKITHKDPSTNTLIIIITLCSLILLLLTLTILFFRRRADRLPTTSHHGVLPAPPRSLGLDVSIINSLPVILHISWVRSNVDMGNLPTECSICLGVFINEDKLKVLPECCHPFHGECLDKWLRFRSSCPLCRASLDEIAVPLS